MSRVALAAAAPALSLTLLAPGASATTHDAAPQKTGTAAKRAPVILVHGINPFSFTGDGTDCADTFGDAKRDLWGSGWAKKDVVTWSYYKDAAHCDVKGVKGDRDTDLVIVGYRLAQWIKKTYGDRPVNLVGHSMGGLVIRQAIVSANVQNWDIRVKDAVTMGTPNLGSGWARACTPDIQCNQIDKVDKGNDYLKELNKLSSKKNKQHIIGGTDWTAMGSGSDEAVTRDSATKGFHLKNRKRWTIGSWVGHSDYPQRGEGGTVYVTRDHGKTWSEEWQYTLTAMRNAVKSS